MGKLPVKAPRAPLTDEELKTYGRHKQHRMPMLTFEERVRLQRIRSERYLAKHGPKT